MNILLDFTPSIEFDRQIILGANQYCLEHPNFHIRTASTDLDILADADVIDGVIAKVRSADPRHPSTRFDKPVVNISAHLPPGIFPTVAQDDRAAGRLAAEHLIEQGYRSFACHMNSRYFFSSKRLEGFSQALLSHKHRCAVFDTAAQNDADAKELYRLTLAWLRALPKPLGLFTHSDGRAAALIDICRDAKLNIPEEIGIIGVDNDALVGQLTRPSLSSVDTGAQLVGHEAMVTLARILRGETAPREPILLPARGVMARESTNPKRLVDDRLRAALSYMRKHAFKGINIDQVLEAVAVSRRSLERLFLNQLGHSPAEELRRIRINHAKWLLAASDKVISDVAIECGYGNYYTFARAFSQDVGITASSYRERFKAPKME